MSDTMQRMTDVFRDVFDDESLVLRENMTASDVEGWDSIAHINMIVGVEREFKIKLTTSEVVSLKTVGDLAALVNKKRNLQR